MVRTASSSVSSGWIATSGDDITADAGSCGVQAAGDGAASDVVIGNDADHLAGIDHRDGGAVMSVITWPRAGAASAA